MEANLPRLAEAYGLSFVPELIAQKREEKAVAVGLDWSFHDSRLTELEALLDRAHKESPLPEERDRQAVNQFLIDCHLRYLTIPA